MYLLKIIIYLKERVFNKIIFTMIKFKVLIIINECLKQGKRMEMIIIELIT